MPYTGDVKRAYDRGWSAGRRALFFEDKTCERCGTRERLALHHRDPTQKAAHSIWSWGRAKRLAEIAKCEVICEPCHTDEHRPLMRELAAIRTREGGRFAAEEW